MSLKPMPADVNCSRICRPSVSPVSVRPATDRPPSRVCLCARAGLQVAPPSGIQRQYQQLQAAAAFQTHIGLQPQQLQLLQNQLGTSAVTSSCQRLLLMAGAGQGEDVWSRMIHAGLKLL